MIIDRIGDAQRTYQHLLDVREVAWVCKPAINSRHFVDKLGILVGGEYVLPEQFV